MQCVRKAPGEESHSETVPESWIWVSQDAANEAVGVHIAY